MAIKKIENVKIIQMTQDRRKIEGKPENLENRAKNVSLYCKYHIFYRLSGGKRIRAMAIAELLAQICVLKKRCLKRQIRLLSSGILINYKVAYKLSLT